MNSKEKERYKNLCKRIIALIEKISDNRFYINGKGQFERYVIYGKTFKSDYKHWLYCISTESIKEVYEYLIVFESVRDMFNVQMCLEEVELRLAILDV